MHLPVSWGNRGNVPEVDRFQQATARATHRKTAQASQAAGMPPRMKLTFTGSFTKFYVANGPSFL
jgi:hypothetical protein